MAHSDNEEIGRRSTVPLAAPYSLLLTMFLLAPLAVIVVVSFWRLEGFTMSPDFTLDNYRALMSRVHVDTYLNTFRFAAIAWFFTTIIGFLVSYFLALTIRSDTLRMTLFLASVVPFLTSNIVRGIVWVPVLGKNGVINAALTRLGVIDQPIESLLFSDQSVVIGLVYLYVPFMVAPMFNAMMRIQPSLLEAARDAGAGEIRTAWDIVVPLVRPGWAIGSIFVFTLVLANFSTVSLLSGGQAGSVGLTISNMLGSLQTPRAAANAVVLLACTLVLVSSFLRLVDVRKQL